MTLRVQTDPTTGTLTTWARKAANAINQLIGELGKYLPLTGGTLTGDLSVPDEAYGVGWNGSTEVPTKNALYDKIEAISAGGVADGDKGDIVVSGSGAVWSFDTGVVTAFAKTFLDDANAGAVRATIGAQADDATLTALAAYNTNGLIAQTAPDTFAGRTLTGPAAGITVTNGNGVAGNPTLALADDLAALEALSGTNTIYYRSAANTWTAVTFSNDLLFSGGSMGVNKGTSFPGSPSSGDRFLRTDRNIRYFYDGTRWLSESLHHINIGISDALMPTSATTAYKHRVGNPFAGDHQLYIEKVKTHAFQTAATTASNYFSLAVILTRTAADGGDTTLATHSTQSQAQNDWINQSTNINSTAVINASGFALSLTETGAQNIYVNAEVSFRLVG